MVPLYWCLDCGYVFFYYTPIKGHIVGTRLIASSLATLDPHRRHGCVRVNAVIFGKLASWVTLDAIHRVPTSWASANWWAGGILPQHNNTGATFIPLSL